MNDQSTKLQPAMVHIDLSNVLPPGAYSYLTAFLPGLFFEISVALANPIFVGKIAANLSRYQFNQYINLGIALFLAFVIGNGFMMGVTLIQWFVARFYVVGFFLRKQCYVRSLIPALNSFMGKRAKGGRTMPSWVADLQEHLHYYANGGIEEDQKDINSCLGILASNLLEAKYSITRDESNRTRNWWIFYVTLAGPTREELRGQTFMIATHATGWCGIVATQLASTLKNRYYLSFSILMIVTGLFHDFYVARGMYNPILLGLANIRGMLREFRKPPRPEAPKSKGDT